VTAYENALAVMRRAANQAGAVAKLVQYTVEPFLPGFRFPDKPDDSWKEVEPSKTPRKRNWRRMMWSWNKRFP
jgi:hypothetical protein